MRTFRCMLRRAVFLLSLGAATAWADGTLTHFSGPVSVEKADGKVLAVSAGLKVVAGDTVVTGVGAYARMETTDGGEMVLRPDTRLKIDDYKFNTAKPAEDSFVFRMVKGGLRTVTGLIGKRGNKDAYRLDTPTATIGIRGTQFDVRVCQANCGALADGTYLAVRFGAVHTANSLGALDVAAGQVAHVPRLAPPVVLPRDPGIGFTPPPAIPKPDERKKQSPPSTAGGSPGASPGGGATTAPPPQGQPRSQVSSTQASGGSVDCTVE